MLVWNVEGGGPPGEAVEGLTGRAERDGAPTGANAPSAEAVWQGPPDRPAA